MVLTSTHNLCFGAKIRKNVYPCKPQFYYIKVGCKGVFITRTCFRDVLLSISFGKISNPEQAARYVADRTGESTSLFTTITACLSASYTPNGYIVPMEFRVIFFPRIGAFLRRTKMHLNGILLIETEFFKL